MSKQCNYCKKDCGVGSIPFTTFRDISDEYESMTEYDKRVVCDLDCFLLFVKNLIGGEYGYGYNYDEANINGLRGSDVARWLEIDPTGKKWIKLLANKENAGAINNCIHS